MNRFLSHFRPSVWVVASVAFFASGTAHAKLCSSNLDCTPGFSCQTITTGSSDCTACAGPNCPPTQTCPPPTTARECYPAPCTSDRDCPSDMICYAATDTTCSTPVSGGGTRGGSQCTTTTHRLCVPQWLPPCTSDSSCGSNLTCQFSTEQSCPPTPPGAPPGTCTTTPSSEGHCKASQIPCGSGTVCPGNWTCESVTTGGTSTCGVSSNPPPNTGGQPPVCTDTPGTTRQLCVPPYYTEVMDIVHASQGSSENDLGLPTMGAVTGKGSGSGDSGGCSVTSREAPRTGGRGFAVVAAAGLLFWRRRAARSGR